MIQPALQDERFLRDVRTASDSETCFHLWWLGQSGFLLRWKKHHLLFDPYLSDSLTRKYASTEKPHVRMTERVIAPDDLDFIDVVTSTHNHTDHLDADTLVPLLRVNPRLALVVPEANREFAAKRIGVPVERLVALEPRPSDRPGVRTTISVGPFHITAVPAAHEKLDVDPKGNHIYVGYVVHFGSWAIYHSGDTVLFDGMEAALRRFQPTLALLPINGRAPERGVSGNLWGHEAAQLAKSIATECVLPCHYDMFEFNTASTGEFESTCLSLGQTYKILKAGERFTWPL